MVSSSSIALTTAIAASAALKLYWRYVPGGESESEGGDLHPQPRRPLRRRRWRHHPKDVLNGDVRIIAPQDFTDEAVSENLYAGNAMYRRATYMYGTGLGVPPPPAPWCSRSAPAQRKRSALGSAFSAAQPVADPVHAAERRRLGDIYRPDEGDRWRGVRVFAGARQRGAERDALLQSRQGMALHRGERRSHPAQFLHAARRQDPRHLQMGQISQSDARYVGRQGGSSLRAASLADMGKEQMVEHIENYRDAFKYIHEPRCISPTAAIRCRRSATWCSCRRRSPRTGRRAAITARSATTPARSTISISAISAANPADLHPLPPPEAAPRYVALMGGAPTVIKRAREAYDKGEYRWVAQLLEHVVYAEPDNQDARNLQADAFEQLGYQSEAATWRNFYFVGAKELRHGVPDRCVDATNAAYLAPNITLALTCEYVGIAIDSDAADNKVIKINFKLESQRVSGAKKASAAKDGVRGLKKSRRPARNARWCLRTRRQLPRHLDRRSGRDAVGEENGGFQRRAAERRREVCRAALELQRSRPTATRWRSWT